MYKDKDGFYHQDHAGESVPCAMANAQMLQQAKEVYHTISSHYTSYNKEGDRVRDCDTLVQALIGRDIGFVRDNLQDKIVWSRK